MTSCLPVNLIESLFFSNFMLALLKGSSAKAYFFYYYGKASNSACFFLSSSASCSFSFRILSSSAGSIFASFLPAFFFACSSSSLNYLSVCLRGCTFTTVNSLFMNLQMYVKRPGLASSVCFHSSGKPKIPSTDNVSETLSVGSCIFSSFWFTSESALMQLYKQNFKMIG